MASASGINFTDAVTSFISDDTNAHEMAPMKVGEEDEGHDNSGSFSREESATGSTGSMTRTGCTEDADVQDPKHDLYSSLDSSRKQSSNLSSPSAATCDRDHPREFSEKHEQSSVEVVEEGTSDGGDHTATHSPGSCVPCTSFWTSVGCLKGAMCQFCHVCPLAPDPRVGQRSEGSAEHEEGKCRPCAWFWKPQGCRNGEECRHCHACGPGELKARKQRKVAELRRLAAIQKAADADEGIAAAPDPSPIAETVRGMSSAGHTSAGQQSAALAPNPIGASWAPSQGHWMGAPDPDSFTLPWCLPDVGSGARSSHQMLQLQRPQFSIAVPRGGEGQSMMVATTRASDVMTPWPASGSMFHQGFQVEQMQRHSGFR